MLSLGRWQQIKHTHTRTHIKVKSSRLFTFHRMSHLLLPSHVHLSTFATAWRSNTCSHHRGLSPIVHSQEMQVWPCIHKRRVLSAGHMVAYPPDHPSPISRCSHKGAHLSTPRATPYSRTSIKYLSASVLPSPWPKAAFISFLRG